MDSSSATWCQFFNGWKIPISSDYNSGLYAQEEGKVGFLFSLAPYTTHLDRFEVFSNDIKSLVPKSSNSGILS